jgi:hypothetical protein
MSELASMRSSGSGFRGAGTMARPTNIDETQWEDVDTALRMCRRSKDEFDFKEYVAPMVGTGIHSLFGSMTITHLKSGVSRVYTTGFGSTWVADFQKDIERGVF